MCSCLLPIIVKGLFESAHMLVLSCPRRISSGRSCSSSYTVFVMIGSSIS